MTPYPSLGLSKRLLNVKRIAIFCSMQKRNQLVNELVSYKDLLVQFLVQRDYHLLANAKN